MDLVFVIVVVVAAAAVFDVPEVPALRSSNGEQTLNGMELHPCNTKRGFVSFSLFLFLSLSVGYLCLRLKPLLMRNNHWINFDSRLVDVEINLLGQELFLCLGHIFSAHV